MNEAVISASDIILFFPLILIIIGCFLGSGNRRKIVIFKNYDDLGLTFLIPVSFFLLSFIVEFIIIQSHSEYLASIREYLLFIPIIVSILIFIKVTINTYNYNNHYILKTIIAILTKLPISVIWVIAIINIINPEGKNQLQRSKNRASALLILTLLTPIVSLLIVEKSGSLFNPREILARKRIGSVRDHL